MGQHRYGVTPISIHVIFLNKYWDINWKTTGRPAGFSPNSFHLPDKPHQEIPQQKQLQSYILEI